MIRSQPAQTNWTAIGIIVAAVINILGWFVVNILSKRRGRQRDVEAGRRDSNLAISDFTATVKRWLDEIGDRQQAALGSIHTKSISEIEQALRVVRLHLDETANNQLQDEWRKYQRMEKGHLDGIQTRHPETGSSIISYDKARQNLAAPLKKMLDIIHPSPGFGPDDIQPPLPRDPNDPIDYDSLHLKQEDL